MSAKHAHDLISAAEVFKIQGGVFLPYLNIGFSNWCNTQYGCADLFAHLTAMCRCGASAEGQYRESRKDPKAHCLPSGRWTLGMIRSIPPDQMLVRCTNMIRFTVRRMKKHGMLDGNLHISIDKHLMPRYDENPDMTNLVKSKHNDGTCTFDCLAVVQGVVDGARAVSGRPARHARRSEGGAGLQTARLVQEERHSPPPAEGQTVMGPDRTAGRRANPGRPVVPRYLCPRPSVMETFREENLRNCIQNVRLIFNIRLGLPCMDAGIGASCLVLAGQTTDPISVKDCRRRDGYTCGE